MRRLLAVTWPLTHLELPGHRLNYTLTDARARRVKILLVLLASGHGVGRGPPPRRPDARSRFPAG